MFGKASFLPEDLLVNLKALQETIDRNRPAWSQAVTGERCTWRRWDHRFKSINALRDMKLSDA